VLLSELWGMSGWNEVDHCRILFELLSETGRSERIREILRNNTASIRRMLADTLKAGQARGEVDPSLDVGHTSAMLIAVLDAAPMLPLMVPDVSFEESRKLLTTMITRFLRPQ